MFQKKVSVFEKAVILDHPIFLLLEALKLRRGQLHFLKWYYVFFSMTLLPILRRIQRPTTQGHFNLPTEDARSDNPRNVNTCSFTDEKTV